MKMQWSKFPQHKFPSQQTSPSWHNTNQRGKQNKRLSQLKLGKFLNYSWNKVRPHWKESSYQLRTECRQLLIQTRKSLQHTAR